MQSEREKLIHKLFLLSYRVEYGTGKESMDLGVVVDFIIQDRKRIVKPLIKFKGKGYCAGTFADNAINETLKNAGCE